MAGVLWVDGPNAPWSFVFVTLILGGLAAFATGRALASAWRPFALTALAVAPLAAAIAFLHYVLFEEPAVPLFRLGAALARLGDSPGEALAEIAASLRFYGVIYAVTLAIAAAGYRRTRAGMMARQYAFAFSRKGMLGWRENA
jgi:hypothetical protein